jgi:hypothetical protein
LAKALAELEGRPWAEWGKLQKPITQNQLARLLSKYTDPNDRPIGPGNIRFPGDIVVRGYEREQFTEAWALYLPPDGSSSPSTPDSKCYTATTRVNTGENGDFQSATAEPCSASENAVSVNKDALGSGVAVSNPLTVAQEGLYIQSEDESVKTGNPERDATSDSWTEEL